MKFGRISPAKFEKKSSIIADQIVEMVRSGKVAVGAKLPSERVIAGQMGVSRPSVREAICALQIAGIVQSQPGDGNYVCIDVVNEDLKIRAMGILEETDSPLEILQARKAAEVGVVRLAIEAATDADILYLKKTWNSIYELVLKDGFEPYLEHGRDFHAAIANVTKNRVIERIMSELLDATSQPLWIKMRREFIDEDPNRAWKLVELHNGLLKAITDRDCTKATLLLEEHFDMLLKEMYDRE